MNHMIVTSTRCPLMLRPTHACEQTDELLLGWGVERLEDGPEGWVRVRTDYRYEGWAYRACLGVNESWHSLPKRVVTKPYCTVLNRPDVQGWPVADLTRGALVSPLGGPDETGWIKVALPDGRAGCTRCSYLGPWYESRPFPEEEFRRRVCDTALSYLNSHYRWGGKSPLGLDCSGLTFMAYRLNGVTIYRDARIHPDFPVREIDRAERKAGDLLFFPGHVALYLGEGRFVHSTARKGSDGVVVNSLDPCDPLYRKDLAETLTRVGSIF